MDQRFHFTFDGGVGADSGSGPKSLNSAGGSSWRKDANEPFPIRIRSSPSLYPIRWDFASTAVDFVWLSQSDYERASFLDERILSPRTMAEKYAWQEVVSATNGLPKTCDFIFHISHVGSTLLSRLLGLHPRFFSLREPAILRRLADPNHRLKNAHVSEGNAANDATDVFLRLWSRVFQLGQRAIIKATSFVSEIADELLDRVSDSRALLIYVAPETFLKALLDGAMTDITGKAADRLNRLTTRLGPNPWRAVEMSPGETVAMSWLCEMMALNAAALRFPTRTSWLNFDHFLEWPESDLASILSHFGCSDWAIASRRIITEPVMNQYAKAPECRFDRRTREALLNRSEQRHREEIRKGLIWLDQAASTLHPVRELLHFVSTASRGN